MSFEASLRSPQSVKPRQRSTTPVNHGSRSTTPVKQRPISGAEGTPRGDLRKPAVPKFTPSSKYQTPSREKSSKAPCDENIQVAVRVRHFLPREEEHLQELAIRMKDQTCQIATHQEKKLFTFDHCFWSHNNADPSIPYATQADVYDSIGDQLVDNALKGFNSTIFAYGQTGSGKTYSLYGPEDSYNTDAEGVIPRVCKELFARIKSPADRQVTYKVQASMIEVYLENVFDLLNEKRKLSIRGSVETGFYVPGLKKVDVSDYLKIQALIQKGQSLRVTAATELNDTSSRAHTLFEIELKQITPHFTTTSKISLVDLAGSERVKDSKVEGINLTQACNINKSLLNLGNCIEAVVEKSKHPNKPLTVPFRDSALTKLLKESLGGNAKTILLVTISPTFEDVPQTLAALRFADRAKQIKTHAVINEDAVLEAKNLSKALHEQYQTRMKRLQDEMQLELRQAEIAEKELELEAEAARLLLERERIAQECEQNRALSERERKLLEEHERELERRYTAVLATQAETLRQREELNNRVALIVAEEEERKLRKQREEEERIVMTEQLKTLREENDNLIAEKQREVASLNEQIELLRQEIERLRSQMDEMDRTYKEQEAANKASFQAELESMQRLQEVKQKKLKCEYEEREREIRFEAQETQEALEQHLTQMEAESTRKSEELTEATNQLALLRQKVAELQDEQTKMQSSHKDVVARMEKDFADRLAAAKKEREEKIASMKQEFESQVTKFQSSSQQKEQSIRKEHEKQMAELNEHMQKQLAASKRSFDERFHQLELAHENEKATLVAKHSTDLQRMAGEMQTAAEEHTAQILQLRSALESRETAVTQRHVTEVERIEALRKEEIVKIRTECESKMVELRTTLTTQHQTAIQAMGESHQKELAALTQQLDSAYHDTMQAAKDAHKKEVATLKEQFETARKTEIQALKETHERELKTRQAKWEIAQQSDMGLAREQLQATHRAEIQMLSETHQREMKALKMKIESTTEELLQTKQSNTKELACVRTEIEEKCRIRYQSEIESVRIQMTETTRIVENEAREKLQQVMAENSRELARREATYQKERDDWRREKEALLAQFQQERSQRDQRIMQLEGALNDKQMELTERNEIQRDLAALMSRANNLLVPGTASTPSSARATSRKSTSVTTSSMMSSNSVYTARTIEASNKENDPSSPSSK